MIRESPDNLFDEKPDGNFIISDDAPAPLQEAIEKASKQVSTSNSWAVCDVGREKDIAEFGEGQLRFVQSESCTLFVTLIDSNFKILSVGVSTEGPLSDEQLAEAMENLSFNTEFSSADVSRSITNSDALRSISQSYHYVNQNSRNLLDSVAKIEELLIDPKENREEIENRAKDCERNLHNVLSSVYTLTETVDNCFKDLGLSRKNKHLIQKYEDDISEAIGLRHCIQHRYSLKIYWVTSGTTSEYVDYTVGIYVPDVADPDLYHGPCRNHKGEKLDPVSYYYGDVDGRVLSIRDLANQIKKRSDKFQENVEELIESEKYDIQSDMEKYLRINVMSKLMGSN